MQSINLMTSNLEAKLDSAEDTLCLHGRDLALAIITAHELLQQTRSLCKELNNQLLVDFFNANIVVLHQMQLAAQEQNENADIIIKSSEVMLQLTHIYQDAIVPLLTRLHNLTDDSDALQKITSITTLGNEVITCSGQINQFNDKFELHEKINAMFGIILMLSSISILVAILSKPTIDIPVLSPLTLMSLGCGVCMKAMNTHNGDPGSDLIITSLKKIEPFIYDVAKNFVAEKTDVEVPPVEVEKKAKKSTTKKPVAKEVVEEIVEVDNPNPTLIGKIKGVFDIFTTKK